MDSFQIWTCKKKYSSLSDLNYLTNPSTVETEPVQPLHPLSFLFGRIQLVKSQNSSGSVAYMNWSQTTLSFMTDVCCHSDNCVRDTVPTV